MPTKSIPRVMFLCTGNACRSQMAEGWARALYEGRLEACSAGTDPKGLDPRATAIMAESGVDISAQHSKSIAKTDPDSLDVVVTVCGHAHEQCPVFMGDTRIVHRGFDDPPRLAREAATEDEALGQYRRVCNEIRAFIETELGVMLGLTGPGGR